MTAPGNTDATVDLWAELDRIEQRRAWAETVARFLHPSAWVPDTKENNECRESSR